jgi:hypothetical protein
MGPRYLGWVCLFCLCSPLQAFSQDADQPDAGKPAPKPAPTKPDASKTAPKKPGSCVAVSIEAAFASVGYDHIVTLTSACKKPMTCTVKTNVNPEPSTLQLDPGEAQSVVTWRGSPAREFTPNVVCVPTRS